MSSNRSKLFIELAKSVELFGDDKIADLLYQERTKDKKSNNISFVIEMVCTRFRLTCEQVFNSKDRNSKRVTALQFIIYYCNEYFEDVTHADIACRVNRDESLVRKHYIAMTAKKKDKDEASLREHYFKFFDAQIKQYIKSV